MDPNDPRCQRVEEDDPRRCQRVTNMGQCRMIAVEGSKYCYAHGGEHTLKAERKSDLRNYRLTQWKGRIQEFGDSKEIKSIRDEVGILRLLMETRLNACHDATDLLLQSATICQLVERIERVVVSCHKLESQMGSLLDKQAIIKIASKMVDVISGCINDLVDQNIIAEDIASSINSAVADALIANMQSLEE